MDITELTWIGLGHGHDTTVRLGNPMDAVEICARTDEHDLRLQLEHRRHRSIFS